MLDVECWAFDVCGRKFICVLPRQSERCLPPPQAATAWQATPLGMTILARSFGLSASSDKPSHSVFYEKELTRYRTSRLYIRPTANSCGGPHIHRLCLYRGERTTMFSREREGWRAGWRRTA